MESGFFEYKICRIGMDDILLEIGFEAFCSVSVIILIDFFCGLDHEGAVAVYVDLLAGVLWEHGELMGDGFVEIVEFAVFDLMFEQIGRAHV